YRSQYDSPESDPEQLRLAKLSERALSADDLVPALLPEHDHLRRAGGARRGGRFGDRRVWLRAHSVQGQHFPLRDRAQHDDAAESDHADSAVSDLPRSGLAQLAEAADYSGLVWRRVLHLSVPSVLHDNSARDG